MLIRIILINLISLISILPNAYAYLDPGTGSFILQAIVGFLAAISAGFIYYWTKVKNFLTKFFKKILMIKNLIFDNELFKRFRLFWEIFN